LTVYRELEEHSFDDRTLSPTHYKILNQDMAFPL